MTQTRPTSPSQQRCGPLFVYFPVKVNKFGICLEKSVPTPPCFPGAILRASRMKAGNYYLQRLLGTSQQGRQKRHWVWRGRTWIQTLALPPAACVTLGTAINAQCLSFHLCRTRVILARALCVTCPARCLTQGRKALSKGRRRIAQLWLWCPQCPQNLQCPGHQCSSTRGSGCECQLSLCEPTSPRLSSSLERPRYFARKSRD